MARPKPLEALMSILGSGSRSASIKPTETSGAPGVAVFGGYVVENEKETALSARERYRTFSEILANTSVAAAGVRYFLNLAAKAEWTFEPAEHPRGEELAERVEQMMREDPRTSWARIVRRAAMYRFYGFSIQEWTARRAEDGLFTLHDVAPRAQMTIERWDMADDGSVLGVVQRNPQNSAEIYLPRGKLLYLVDDTLHDSPQGLGLFRHIVEPAQRLQRYLQLEGVGFEKDLRGIPVGYAPYEELRREVAAGNMTEAEAKLMLQPIESFLKKHLKSPEQGLMIDSQPYVTTDESTRPSSAKKFSVELLQGGSTTLPDLAKAIERVNREIARVLGVEAILLGDGDRGSHALSRDKTNQFSLTIDATLQELAEAFRDDLMRTLFRLNGWPEEAMPEMKPEAVQYRDVEQVTAALRDMAQAGAMLEPDDPAIADVRALLGIEAPDTITRDDDESLNGDGADDALEDDETLDDEEDEGAED